MIFNAQIIGAYRIQGNKFVWWFNGKYFTWEIFLSLLFVFRCKDFNTYTENLSYPEKRSCKFMCYM